MYNKLLKKVPQRFLDLKEANIQKYVSSINTYPVF